MGNTAIMCTVHGPHESSGAGNAGEAVVEVDVNVAGFAGVDRKRRAGGSDKYALEKKKKKKWKDKRELTKSLDKPYNYQTRFAQPFNRIYIPTSTHTAQSVYKSPYSRQMAHC
jgi:hypothetical protein